LTDPDHSTGAALDGIVVSGASAIDQSPLPGNRCRKIRLQGSVFAGTLSQTGFGGQSHTLTNDTTVSRIIHLVEAARSRAPTQQWVDRFAAIYTPVVPSRAGIAFIPLPWRATVCSVDLPGAGDARDCLPVRLGDFHACVDCECHWRWNVRSPVQGCLGDGRAHEHPSFDKTGTLTQGLPIVQKIYSLGEMVRRRRS